MLKLPISLILLIYGLLGFGIIQGQTPPSRSANPLVIRSVVASGKFMPRPARGEVNLGTFPDTITFEFGAVTNSGWLPARIRYKLEGFDNAWHEGPGEMFLSVRFYDESGDLITAHDFNSHGDSSGWNGTLKSSTLTHRRETVVAPPRASRLLVVLSSAGPPATVGIYVVDDLVVSRLSNTNGMPSVVLRALHDPQAKDEGFQDWVRDGNRPSMARIVDLGFDPETKALAILDDDSLCHAEWHNRIDRAPKMSPGERVVVEWNELFSMGVGDMRAAHYASLPPGKYLFRVEGVSVLGIPTGVEDSLAIRVPLPLYDTPWFWSTMVMVVLAGGVMSHRYYTWQKMRREMSRLQHQRALEQERLRIAQDIHDDLGARVTQISLVSAMAQHSLTLEKARGDFDRISRMSRELVSALYETVWAVNPENDNLDALGNYICQMANQLCESAHLPCRLKVVELPDNIQVTSQTRHNITMAVKEAVHNAIKHSKASEITIHVSLAGMLLTVSIQDNGCGLPPQASPDGNGLDNIRRRLEQIGGSCSFESQPGRGTTVHLRLELSENPVGTNRKIDKAKNLDE